MSPWMHQVAEMLHAGRREEALALVQSLADLGSTAALVRLAVFGEEAGIANDLADAMVEQAEQEASQDDADAHWALHSAYEVRLGLCEYDEKARRALQHLVKYAELTKNAQAAYAVAVRYGQGDIGTQPNLQLAETWMQRAVAFGHPLAKAWLARNFRK